MSHDLSGNEKSAKSAASQRGITTEVLEEEEEEEEEERDGERDGEREPT
jgi:hypothetical protein